MEVQALPIKVRCDSLSAHTEVNHQGEAGNRAQSEPNQIGTLALIGGYYGELKVKHLKKRLNPKRESEYIPISSPLKPAANYIISCLNLGLVTGEVVTPKVSKQSKERNEEKRHQLHGADNLCGEP